MTKYWAIGLTATLIMIMGTIAVISQTPQFSQSLSTQTHTATPSSWESLASEGQFSVNTYTDAARGISVAFPKDWSFTPGGVSAGAIFTSVRASSTITLYGSHYTGPEDIIPRTMIFDSTNQAIGKQMENGWAIVRSELSDFPIGNSETHMLVEVGAQNPTDYLDGILTREIFFGSGRDIYVLSLYSQVYGGKNEDYIAADISSFQSVVDSIFYDPSQTQAQ